jgi:hypothetical protein
MPKTLQTYEEGSFLKKNKIKQLIGMTEDFRGTPTNYYFKIVW